MGTKIVLNEFVAILDLKDTATTLAPRTVGIVTVFLISFASISQIGAIVGTIRALSEKQGSVVSKFGWKMLFASTLASILSATIGRIVYLIKNHLCLDSKVIFLLSSFKKLKKTLMPLPY